MSRAAIPAVIVGYGRMGRLHAATLARLREFDLVGVVDSDPECAAAAADAGLAFHRDIGELRGRARLAIVAVPSATHAEVFRDVVAHGMDCLVEKPVGASLSELEAMAALARAAGVRVYAGYSERFNPVMPGVDAALRAAPRAVTVRRLSSSALDRNFDTDVMYDLLAHDLDWVLRALGEEPVDVAVEARRFRAGRLEEIVCRLDFSRGVCVRLTASRIAQLSERSVAVAGFDGRAHRFDLDGWRVLAVEDGLTRQARALAAALRGEASGVARIEDALRVQGLLARMDVCEAALADVD